MVHMEQKLDQCIFIKLSHRDYSGGGWASYIVGGDGKAGGFMKSWRGWHPLRKYGEEFKNICGMHSFTGISMMGIFAVFWYFFPYLEDRFCYPGEFALDGILLSLNSYKCLSVHKYFLFQMIVFLDHHFVKDYFSVVYHNLLYNIKGLTWGTL